MTNGYIFGRDFHEKYLEPRTLTRSETNARRAERDRQETADLPLFNVEQIYNALLDHPDLVVIDQAEAAVIWDKFAEPLPATHFKPLDYRAFLQAAMMGAIDASFAIGLVETVWRTFAPPAASATSLPKLFGKLSAGTLRHLYRRARNGSDISKAEVHIMTLFSIKFGCDVYFRTIREGAPLSVIN